LIKKEKIQTCEIMNFKEEFTVIKYKNDEDYKKKQAYQVLTGVCEGGINCMLNAGITALWNLMTGDSANHLDNSNAQIGVGNSNTVAESTQTDLQGGSVAWSVMDVTFPQVSNQKVTFAGDFGSAEANFHWEECAVRYSTAGTVLNRVVADKGTKSVGETWIAKLEITGS